MPPRFRFVPWLVVGLLLTLLALPVRAAGEEVRGGLNGWGATPWAMSGNLGGSWLYTTSAIASCAAGGDFKFYRSDAGGQWYSNGSAVTFATKFTGLNTSTGPNMNFACTAGKFYAFKWSGSGGADGVVFELSAAPVSVAGVVQSPIAPTNAQGVTITATTGAPPPSEQALWLRYTVNAWASSVVQKMTGSGTTYTATIPAQPNNTTVSYYVFTSGNVGSIAGGEADLMALTYDTNGGANYAYNVGAIGIPDAQALWLDVNTLGWNGTVGSSYKLLYDADGGLNAGTAGVTACTFPAPAGPCYVSLTPSGTVSGYGQNPNATGLPRLLTGLSAANAKHLLKGEVAVASYNSGGTLLDLSRVQMQSVLDALYAANAQPQGLGLVYSGTVPTLKVWAPTAKAVWVRRYADFSTGVYTRTALTEDVGSGVWGVTGDATWNRQFYLLEVQVYVPSTDAVENNLVTDPYAVSLSGDTASAADPRSQFVNLNDADLKPAGWDSLTKPPLANPEDIVIYETHIRDFSINDITVNVVDRGTYNAFTYDGNGAPLSAGMNHLKQLQAAGLTHIHLLPVFDIASVDELPITRTVWPNPTGYAANSSTQQTIVSATRQVDGFNWGYDPMHYGAPEGSYSTDPNGVARIREFRGMVQALNENGLRVVMDVVYNHVAASGQYEESVLDKVVPGYYLRYTTNGALYTSSCCSDTASEYAMMEKLMVDTLTRWAVDYKVDGFRFDLMNFHTRQNMLNIKSALGALTVPANGVDGSKIYLYGEGWDFGSAAEKGLTTCPHCYAKQYNMTGAGIGLFNDTLRDAAHGGYNSDATQVRHQGFINGLSYDWNGYCYSNRFQSDLWAATASLRTTLAGSGGLFADDPQESINYVEKHDNETLFDQNVFKLPSGDGAGLPGWCGSGGQLASLTDRVRAQNLGTSLTGLAQGVPFFQMGQDVLRSKSLDRNSYDSGDWFNRVDWGKTTNYFGSGLPPAWDNSGRWGIMGPLLANTGIAPTTTQITATAAHLREVLRLRQSSPLFRLTTEADANNRITFYNTNNTHDALIVMALSDEPSPDLDPSVETLLVFFNANKTAQTYTIGAAAGLSFTLHPIQADALDADPVVQTSSFNNGTGAFTIPARTMAVFGSAQAFTATSNIDWVGWLWPRGGVANARTQGGSSTGFTIYTQVYEPGVTPGAGQGANIGCYLHWGEYGGAWQDVAMSYNAGVTGSNDEYSATLSSATLNALGPGTYGYTTYCKFNNESGKKWKEDSYNIGGNAVDDDQGDGRITILPNTDLFPAPPAAVTVHLFEWRWPDVEKECPTLAQLGYTGVQVSPPNEHLVPTADEGGYPESDYPWWVRYQPVTHRISTLTSRSGTLAEFQSMVNACNAAGVNVYVDAVFNHMAFIEVGAPAAGTAGTQYAATQATRFYGTQYAAANFHADCDITDYTDRRMVQNCLLSGLPDLDTGQPYVQGQVRNYLQALLDMGVKGLRIDAAKHIPAQDLAAILDPLTLPGGGRPYIYQEVIDTNPAERIRDWEYVPNGDVQDFSYSTDFMANNFNQCNSGKLSNLVALSTATSLLDSRFAMVFVDNHDNQRGHGAGGGCIVDHRDGAVYDLANVFMLAYPYGQPLVMSSYYWQSNPATNTRDSYGPPSADAPYTTGSGPNTRAVYSPTQTVGAFPLNCSDAFEDGKWVCEHRRPAIANLVRFRAVTEGELVANWWDNGNNHIAFGRGAKGFVALNRETTTQTTTYQTALPAGTYCNVAQYDFVVASGQCVYPRTTNPIPPSLLVTVTANSQVVNYALPSNSALALHIGARVNFSATLFVITPTAGAGGSILPSTPQTVTSGSTLTFTITPNVGYHIVDVRVDGVSFGIITSYTFPNITANHTISAVFAINTHTLAVATAGAGSGVVTPTTGIYTYTYGSVVTLTASANVSSTFGGWSLSTGAGCGGTGACVVTMTRNAAVTATFSLNTYTLTPTAGAGGSIVPNTPQTVNYGGTFTFTIFPNGGYHIVDVSVDGISQGPITNYPFPNVTAHHTISAAFALNTYTLAITTTGTGNGIITPTLGVYTYTHGSVVTLTATANAGSVFMGWSGGGCSGTGNCTLAMTSNRMVSAMFEAIVYKVYGPFVRK